MAFNFEFIETQMFELLTNTVITNVDRNRLYWPVFISINFCIIGTGSIVVCIRKRIKQNLVQKIHIGKYHRENKVYRKNQKFLFNINLL